jgi:nitrogen fixation/metabolism regulation signal transduction histidine kinase
MESQKRRQFWIDPPLQFQMAATVLLLVLASIFLVAYSVIQGLNEAAQSTHQVFHSLDWVRQTIRGPIIISSLIAVAASALIALIWSHRYAGPLRVLSAAVARIGNGNLSVPVRIRKLDTHQDLVGGFAQAQERLRQRLDADLRGLQAAAGRLQAALPELEGKKEALPSAQALIKEIEAAASHYQL